MLETQKRKRERKKGNKDMKTGFNHDYKSIYSILFFSSNISLRKESYEQVFSFFLFIFVFKSIFSLLICLITHHILIEEFAHQSLNQFHSSWMS